MTIASSPDGRISDEYFASRDHGSAGQGSSLVVAFTGPRGSDKTLLQTFLALMDMRRGKECLSNYKIKGPMMSQGQLKVFKSGPLEYENLLTFSEALEGKLLAIDELPVWFNSLQFQSKGSQIFGLFIQQIRKKQMAVYYTAQNMKWVDNRVRWQTDLHVMCQDMHHTPWGKEMGLESGEYMRYIVMDLSGYSTGIPYESSGVTYHGWLDCRPVRRYYNTDETVDIWQAMMKVNVNRQEMVIDPWGNYRPPGEPEEPMPIGSAPGDERGGIPGALGGKKVKRGKVLA
ncbi:MAG: hypothetical protein PHV74_12485 [Dehalococcoidia bacterium]|nr:hypothetical protein [Dehalococcoidia bacterium]